MSFSGRQWGRCLMPAVFGVCAGLLPASAAEIVGEVTDLGGGDYEIAYTVTPDLDEPVVQFSLFFDPAVYGPIATEDLSAPGDWDPVAFGPEPLLGFDDIVADFLDLSEAGIDSGASLSGFLVRLSVLPGETLGPQMFEFLDPDSFETLATGFTELRFAEPPVSPVPLPAGAVLFAGPLALVILRKFRSFQ